jgi:GT2 family glycosyltransferase
MIPFMVVPTLTRKDLLYDMLSSVDAAVETLLIVDNGDQDLGLMWVPAIGSIRVADIGANLGVAASWNLGLKAGFSHEWVMIVSDDVTFPPGALAEFAAMSGPDKVVLSSSWPHWCAFTIGMRVVQRIGLFDEGFYPAYFEDTDYQRRLANAKIEPILGPEVGHRNSSTLTTADRHFSRANSVSFDANHEYIVRKWQNGGEAEPWDPYRWRSQQWL